MNVATYHLFLLLLKKSCDEGILNCMHSSEFCSVLLVVTVLTAKHWFPLPGLPHQEWDRTQLRSQAHILHLRRFLLDIWAQEKNFLKFSPSILLFTFCVCWFLVRASSYSWHTSSKANKWIDVHERSRAKRGDHVVCERTDSAAWQPRRPAHTCECPYTS